MKTLQKKLISQPDPKPFSGKKATRNGRRLSRNLMAWKKQPDKFTVLRMPDTGQLVFFPVEVFEENFPQD
jgi:hypothetical protein